MIEIKVKSSFIYPELPQQHYQFGSGAIVGKVINESSDWRPSLPKEEPQNINGVESSACYINAQQECIATLQEKQHGLLDKNYSSRFNFIMSGGTEMGGDPIKGADSIRHDGLVDEAVLPFNEKIRSWVEFASFKGGSKEKCIDLGMKWLEKWKPRYDIVFTKEDTLEAKYFKLRQALKYSPIPMSVLAWYQNEKGEYIKPKGGRDQHLVLCVYLDENNCPWIWDTYYPFLKKLEPYYDSDFAMRWNLTKISSKSLWYVKIINYLKKFI